MIAVDIRSFFLLRSKKLTQARLKSSKLRLSTLERIVSGREAKNPSWQRRPLIGSACAKLRSWLRKQPRRFSSLSNQLHRASTASDSSSLAPSLESEGMKTSKFERLLVTGRRETVANSVLVIVDPVKKFFKKQRAEAALLTVFIVFVICWTPFFTTNVLQAIVTLPPSYSPLFITFVWLGYCSSGFNPIIYPLFNKEYRKCFEKTFQLKQKFSRKEGKLNKRLESGSCHSNKEISTDLQQSSIDEIRPKSYQSYHSYQSMEYSPKITSEYFNKRFSETNDIGGEPQIFYSFQRLEVLLQHLKLIDEDEDDEFDYLNYGDSRGGNL